MKNPIQVKNIKALFLGLLAIAVTAVVIGYSMETGKKWAD